MKMSSYYPKRPIKSFQDLEVYQRALAICVAVVKRIASQGNTSDGDPKGLLRGGGIGERRSSEVNEHVAKLHQTVLSLPILIATAHSLRFSNQEGAIGKLEEAMLNCNLAVVYLEQYRDIINIKYQKSNTKNTEQKSKIINDPVAEVNTDISKHVPADSCVSSAPIAERNAEVEIEFFDEQIKNLLATRMKIMHLQRSWKKFMKEANNA
jgi:hypothetical protein